MSKLKESKKYNFIIMYQALPTKSTPCRVINKKLESSIKKLLLSHGYKFVGSGYDFTNERRDIQYQSKSEV